MLKEQSRASIDFSQKQYLEHKRLKNERIDQIKNFNLEKDCTFVLTDGILHVDILLIDKGQFLFSRKLIKTGVTENIGRHHNHFNEGTSEDDYRALLGGEFVLKFQKDKDKFNRIIEQTEDPDIICEVFLS